ncbi:putative Charged multivesicular body protein 1 [Blattamonas nauphoetae]|uniref:Charged multivesicular body protein 1 n=1 Tax=Blattamonas nauphoetae TaxID=2049346 RepID=A0ABQ9Y0S8_9EUKA|nr:putative Charged multivesicular body protein 1 [Blattamonas nauphoetae]
MMDPKLQNTIFELKMTSKNLNRQSTKSKQRSEEEKRKIKKAIQQGNAEGAKIYAENAIREKNMSMMYLKLASRLDGIQSRLSMTAGMQSVVQGIDQVCKQLQRVSNQMDIQKVNKILDKFDQQVTHMETVSDVVMGAMDDNTQNQIASSEVNQLISQVADENQLQLDGEFSAMTAGNREITLEPLPAQPESSETVDDRLRRLLDND